MNPDRDLFAVALGDGRPPLLFVGLSLVLSGGFAIFLAATGQFLPHDIAYLGMTAEELCELQGCRIVNFMVHDRIAFGGALMAVGLFYLWLIAYPLSNREPWSWWTLVFSGGAGFTSFMTYLGYGYLDSWHGLATLLLIPPFLLGLVKSQGLLSSDRSIRSLLRAAVPIEMGAPSGIGRGLLLLVSLGMLGGGFVISTIGISEIFVPQDLAFMAVTVSELQNMNERLISLIAHDRAGFGGAIFSTGIAAFLTLWNAQPSRSLWQILLLSGGSGFGFAIGTHYVVGYNDLVHLAPAYLGALTFTLGMFLTRSWLNPATEHDGFHFRSLPTEGETNA